MPVDYPFHSPQMDGLQTVSEAIFSRLRLSSPQIPIVTVELGDTLNEPSARHLWGITRNVVNFAGTIRRLEAIWSILLCGSWTFWQHGYGC